MANAFSQRGLTFRQILLTLGAALLVGAMVTALQSWNSLQAERAAAEQRMALLTDAARKNAAAAAFRLDEDLAAYVTAGLASSAVIAEARILDERGALLSERIDVTEDRVPDWFVELAYGDLGPMTAALYGLARPELRVGQISVVPDRQALASEFLGDLRTLVLLDLAKTVLLAIVLSVLFYFFFTQPLLRLVHAVRGVVPGSDQALGDVDALRARNDEFARLVRTFDEQLVLFSQVLDERGSLLDELRLRNAALGAMDAAVAIVDARAEGYPIVDANRAMAQLAGVDGDALIGHGLVEFLDRAQRSETAYASLRAFIDAGVGGASVSDAFELYRDDGTPMWGKCSILPVPDEHGELAHRVVIINDITRARATEEQLRHSQKMDALGQVAGGIAHDFNNMLAVMKGHLELTRMDLQDSPRVLAMLEPVDRSVDRAAELTRRMLRFSRTTPIREDVVVVDDLVRQMREMLQSSLTPEIEVVLDLDMRDARVRLDRGDLEDALLNLAVNARDAMPSGGTLTISTRERMLEQGASELRGELPPGAYLVLSIADTGSGMDAQTRARLFEPFFTTKGEFEGTGLGLSQVYGFVERSRGHIGVESRAGEGTDITILLPLRSEAADDAAPARSEPSVRGGSETILLVDDEAELLSASRQILERLGYTVVASTDPAEALARFEAQPERFDLLLSDVVMPGGLNGYDLAEAIRAIVPGLPVLMVSGYDSRKAITGTSFPLLPKPYSREALATEVRRVLDREAARDSLAG